MLDYSRAARHADRCSTTVLHHTREFVTGQPRAGDETTKESLRMSVSIAASKQESGRSNLGN